MTSGLSDLGNGAQVEAIKDVSQWLASTWTDRPPIGGLVLSSIEDSVQSVIDGVSARRRHLRRLHSGGARGGERDGDARLPHKGLTIFRKFYVKLTFFFE